MVKFAMPPKKITTKVTRIVPSKQEGHETRATIKAASSIETKEEAELSTAAKPTSISKSTSSAKKDISIDSKSTVVTETVTPIDPVTTPEPAIVEEEALPTQELEYVNISACQEDGCRTEIHEMDEVSGSEYCDEVEEEEYDDEINTIYTEGTAESQERELEDRYATVPVTSVTSPRYIARTTNANRVLSPRRGDVRSPKRMMGDDKRVSLEDTKKPDPRKKSSNLEDLHPDDLIYDDVDIASVELSGYDNIRAADVITWLIAVGRCPYVFKDQENRICSEIDATKAAVVQYSDDVDEAFEVFECIQGILAFNPVNDIDFGYDEDTAHHLESRQGEVYIVPVISSGTNAGAIRFVDDMEMWGLMDVETYNMIRTRKDYRNVVKRSQLRPISMDE
jgi:hypothetical protein